jgi:glucose-6-phosphate dehydrogenase assembly protein OpcA
LISNNGKISESVAAVEAELAQIWAPPDPESAERAKVRASTMNLVVVSIASELEALRESTDDLNQTHAGRTFLCTVDARLAPWDLETSVAAVCRDVGGAAPICADRIEIALGPMVAARAASVVSALTLSEVPTILEVGKGAPAQVVDPLARTSDRVVVDTAHTSVTRVAEIARSTRAPLADRAFVRGFTWRELCARFFDDAPRMAFAIRSVTLERTAGGRDPVPLVLGWLGSRLGWKFESQSRAVDRAGSPVEITVRVDDRVEIGSGELTAVRMTTEREGERIDLVCERPTAARVLRWIMRGPTVVEHEHPLGFRDETWVMIKAIDSTEGDSVYREAVLAAAAWVSA